MTGTATSETTAGPSFGEAFMVWLKIGCINFGGPAGQIALMHRVTVDEKKWVDEARFLHALNFCMLLPGPEAQKLATYLGWLLHGVRGGLSAGILFVLPGAFVMLGLSLLYAMGRGISIVDGALFGTENAPAPFTRSCGFRRYLFSGAAVPADCGCGRADWLFCRTQGTGPTRTSWKD